MKVAMIKLRSPSVRSLYERGRRGILYNLFPLPIPRPPGKAPYSRDKLIIGRALRERTLSLETQNALLFGNTAGSSDYVEGRSAFVLLVASRI